VICSIVLIDPSKSAFLHIPYRFKFVNMMMRSHILILPLCDSLLVLDTGRRLPQSTKHADDEHRCVRMVPPAEGGELIRMPYHLVLPTGSG
jgi:hypothetical protein